MTPISRATKFDRFRHNGIDYTLAYINDALGKKAAYFRVEEPGKAEDAIVFTMDELRALKELLSIGK